uniref:Fibronectin type-III domain-containing protein n=1 Tax=Amphimedon queenslandica TaxID=400682 RepID=A0A1X7T2V4_AMPQE
MLVTILFGFLIRCCLTKYVTQPVSLNTSLNSTVTYTCEATGVSFILFYVGQIPASEDINSNKGFVELNQVTINGTIRRRQLSVHAREINNNSIIYCFAVPGEVRSDNATLTIQGLLASVGDLDYTFINGSSVLLTWTAPYTLDNVPITGYYIVNGLVNITTTNKSIILSATNPDPCILNNVSVSPINDVGIGSSNNISFYYKTVPLITPPVSVVPVIDEQQVLMNISINASELCKGEYPNSITVNILNTDNAVINSTSIPTQVNDQLMITGVIIVPNNLNVFIVNVSLSNNGRELFTYTFFWIW